MSKDFISSKIFDTKAWSLDFASTVTFVSFYKDELTTLKPRTDKQFFLDKLLLLVCTLKNRQVFLDKEPGLKASHGSFQLVKVFVFGRVYGRPGKTDKEMRNVPMRM